MKTTTSRTALFGPYALDVHSGELRKFGRRVKMGEQTFQILFLLLERSGEVVSREELRAKLWADDTFVDFDHGLNSAIQRLRDCLADSAGKPRWVETVPRRGYRFVGQVEWSEKTIANGGTRETSQAEPTIETVPIAAEMRADLERLKRDSSSGRVAALPSDSTAGVAAPSGQAAGIPSAEVPAIRSRPSVGRKLALAGAILLLLVLAVVGALYRRALFHTGLAETGFQNLTISSLSSTGDVTLARISPDGRYLAYVSTQHEKYSLWVRQIATTSAVRTVSPGTNTIVDVTFTPDGGFLDYTVFTGQDANGKVYQIPMLGGTPQLLLDKADTGVSFSSDGSQMAYALQDVQSSEVQVMLAKADGSGSRKLAGYPGWVPSGGYIVRWSPDGQRIAAARHINDPEGLVVGLLEVDVATGRQKPMPGRHWRDVVDFTWLPDGSGLLLAAQPKTATEKQLWLVTYPGGAVRRISNDLSSYLSVAVSGDGRAIASVQMNITSDLWVGPANAPDQVQQVTSGRLDGNFGVTFTLDNQIVYGGNHSQNWDIFLADAEGSNARQLTFDQHFHGTVSVCDHGRSIVYFSDFSDFDGTSHLWKLDPHTGASSKLTYGAGELVPTCGGDGDWIFYWGQVAGGTSYVFKVPAAGGTPIRVSDRVALSPGFVSLDGHHVAFGTPRKDGTVELTVVSADKGAPESEIPAAPTFDNPTFDNINAGCWMPDNRSLALVDLRTGTPDLWAIPLFGGPQTQLTHFSSGVIWACAYSADGKLIALARGSRQSDAVLFTSAN
jgi:DNA-binding winged helix-turn-helix (wHTH) protein/Tol biopolymer transport system component